MFHAGREDRAPETDCVLQGKFIWSWTFLAHEFGGLFFLFWKSFSLLFILSYMPRCCLSATAAVWNYLHPVTYICFAASVDIRNRRTKFFYRFRYLQSILLSVTAAYLCISYGISSLTSLTVILELSRLRGTLVPCTEITGKTVIEMVCANSTQVVRDMRDKFDLSEAEHSIVDSQRLNAVGRSHSQQPTRRGLKNWSATSWLLFANRSRRWNTDRFLGTWRFGISTVR